jgi:hypothetical protein
LQAADIKVNPDWTNEMGCRQGEEAGNSPFQKPMLLQSRELSTQIVLQRSNQRFRNQNKRSRNRMGTSKVEEKGTWMRNRKTLRKGRMRGKI